MTEKRREGILRNIKAIFDANKILTPEQCKILSSVFDILSKENITRLNSFDAEAYLSKGNFGVLFPYQIKYKFYKFVRKNGEKYYSFYDSTFEYKLNEVAIARGSSAWSTGLYGGKISNYEVFTNYRDKDAVLIELAVEDLEDILALDNFRVKKARFIREVPKEEYHKEN